MTNDERLSKFLSLTPLTDPAMPYSQFLLELKQHLERAETAPALILRAIKELGEENPEEERDPERRQFLLTLKDAGIKSWKAFYHVCGSQLFAARLIARYLEPASSNGAQLKKMVVVEGGPGSGKDYFVDGIEFALEAKGKVYAVKGCPDTENPINLLKLLSEEQRDGLAAELGLGYDLSGMPKQLNSEQRKRVADILGVSRDREDLLDLAADALKSDKDKEVKRELASTLGVRHIMDDLLAVAGDPCQHCYTELMGSIDKPNSEPNLSNIKVEAIRLSKRTAGIAEWKPGDSCSLVAALRRANRGLMSLPDAFIKREAKQGETDERLVLLDTTQYRRLPGAVDACGPVAAASPLDVVTWATTNKKAWSEFLETLPDKDAFTGRTEQLKLPYNMVRVEELRAYMREMGFYKERARFDPLALKMIATLAVISRYAVPKEGEPFVHPIDRMRLLQGERIQVKARSGTEWGTVWNTGSSSSGSSSGYGYSSYEDRWGTRPSSSTKETTSANVPNAMPVPADVVLTPVMMWGLIGPEEGLYGLDMRFMLGLLSRINQRGLEVGKHRCVTALEAIAMLRSAIYNQLTNTSNLTPEQKAVLQRCQKWLGGAPMTDDTTWTKSATEKPELIEAEYRRLLKQQILHVFAPHYDRQAQDLYITYKIHAPAVAAGDAKVKDPRLNNTEVPVDRGIVDEIDRYRLGKGPSDWIRDEERLTGVKIKTAIDDAKEKFIGDNIGEVKPDDPDIASKRKTLAARFQESWETIPELAAAIRAKLDHEVGKKVEKLLMTEVTSDLTEDEQRELEAAKKALFELGYCESSVKPVLEYAKRVKVWAHKA